MPKGSKLAKEAQQIAAATGGKEKRKSRKNSLKEGGQKSGGAGAQQQAPKSMYNLLKNLAPDASEEGKAEESLSEDEDVTKLVDRRMSLNKDNVVGLDFGKYEQIKPS